MSEKVVVHIDPENAQLRLECHENGVVRYKEISKDVLLGCIRESRSQEAIATGILPQNCFHFARLSNGERDYCLWHPERCADISYYKTQYLHFPLPRLVFGFQVNSEGKVFHSRLGVVEDQKLTEDTPMYEYPFSNVGGFSLCLGNNALPTYQNISTLATLPYYLLSLPNNNDRFNKSHNQLRMDHRELLHHLKDKDPAYYYSDVLVPMGKTLRDFIRVR